MIGVFSFLLYYKVESKGKDGEFMKTNHLNVVIAGGGSTYTPGIVQAMISSRERFPFSSLTLYDIDEARNDDMFEIIRYMLKKEALSNEVDLYQTTDAQAAFTGADFIFSQLRVGGMKMRELDEKIPMKYTSGSRNVWFRRFFLWSTFY